MIGVGNRYHVDANITNANITNANITANVPGLKGRGLDAVRIHCVK